MPEANAKTKTVSDALSGSQFRPDYFWQDAKDEGKVLRVWIPLDPNDNPHPNLQQTQLSSVHHWSRASIISLIATQISHTKQVFATMCSLPVQYPTASRLNAASILCSMMGEVNDTMKPMREAHESLALRLKGVEVCEWVEEFERVEVYWEDVEYKMGLVENGDRKRFLEGVERDRKIYGDGGFR